MTDPTTTGAARSWPHVIRPSRQPRRPYEASAANAESDSTVRQRPRRLLTHRRSSGRAVRWRYPTGRAAGKHGQRDAARPLASAIAVVDAGRGWRLFAAVNSPAAEVPG